MFGGYKPQLHKQNLSLWVLELEFLISILETL